MTSLVVRAAWEALRTRDGATLNGTYLTIGGPLEHNCFLLKMVNQSGSDVLISIDGVTAIDICPAGGFWLYDECSNASREGGLTVPRMTQFYINGGVTVGNIYLVAQYAGT